METNQVIEETLEELIETTDETTLEDPSESEQTIEETTENPDIKKIAENVVEILSIVQVSNRKDEINKELHEELQAYKI